MLLTISGHLATKLFSSIIDNNLGKDAKFKNLSSVYILFDVILHAFKFNKRPQYFQMSIGDQ